MLRMVVSKAAVASVVVVGVVSGVATPAYAPKYIFGSFAYGDCDLASVEGARFEGEFTILGFSADKGQLLVTAMVSGVCKSGAFTIAATPIPDVYTFPVDSLHAHCEPDSALLQVRPGATTVVTREGEKFTLDLSVSTVAERWWDAGEPAYVRAHLCAIDRLIDRQPYDRLAPVLDQLVLH